MGGRADADGGRRPPAAAAAAAAAAADRRRTLRRLAVIVSVVVDSGGGGDEGGGIPPPSAEDARSSKSVLPRRSSFEYSDDDDDDVDDDDATTTSTPRWRMCCCDRLSRWSRGGANASTDTARASRNARSDDGRGGIIVFSVTGCLDLGLVQSSWGRNKKSKESTPRGEKNPLKRPAGQGTILNIICEI